MGGKKKLSDGVHATPAVKYSLSWVDVPPYNIYIGATPRGEPGPAETIHMSFNKLDVIRAAVTSHATDAELLRLLGSTNGTRVRGILYRGPSMIDGQPIVAIATSNTNNPKTGELVQIWILLADMHPQEALVSGADKAICGYCPHRPQITTKILQSGPNKGLERFTLNRSCYVNIMGPTSVWNAYNRGKYQEITSADFAGARVRWGAYGDPAAIPAELFHAINAYAAEGVGYTHQWQTKQGKKFRGALMASVDTPAQEIAAQAAGWATFRVGMVDGSDQGETRDCPAVTSNKEITCSDCMACDGSNQTAIYVPAHGQTAKLVPIERLARRKAAKPAKRRAGMRAA